MFLPLCLLLSLLFRDLLQFSLSLSEAHCVCVDFLSLTLPLQISRFAVLKLSLLIVEKASLNGTCY